MEINILMLTNSAEEVAHLFDDLVNCFSERFFAIFVPVRALNMFFWHANFKARFGHKLNHHEQQLQI